MGLSEIDPKDILIEVYPIEGMDRRGGQQVGSGHSGVRITHLPSGTVAFVNVGRSQHRNKAIAEDMILSALTHPRFRS